MVPKGLRKINIETKKIKIIRKRILSKKKEGEKMGFLDTFKGKQYKAELENLQQEHEALKKK